MDLSNDNPDHLESTSQQPPRLQRDVPLDSNCPNCKVREEHCTCVQGWNRRHRTNQHTPMDYNEADHVFLEEDTFNPSPPRYRENLFDPDNDNAFNPRDWLLDNTSSSKRERDRKANSVPKSILKVKTDEICSQALERLSQEHDTDDETNDQPRRQRSPDLVVWSLPDDYDGSDFDDVETETNRCDLPEIEQEPKFHNSPEVDLDNFNFDDFNDFDGPDNYDPRDHASPFENNEQENLIVQIPHQENVTKEILKVQYPNEDLIDEIIDMETNELEDLSQGKSVIPSKPTATSKRIKDIKNQKKKKISKHVQFSKEPPRKSVRIREHLLEKDLQPRSVRSSRTRYNLR